MSAFKPHEALPGASADADSENITTDICVIGAGPGGLAVATAAAAFGRSVVLIERHKFGGDALNYGCIPSAPWQRRPIARTPCAPPAPSACRRATRKSTRAQSMRTCRASSPRLEPNFAAERFVGLGVRVIRAAARFINKKTVVAGEYRIRARRFVIATGSAPLMPAIPGLDSVPYFTNETIFDNQERLHSLIIIGGGPNRAGACAGAQPARLARHGARRPTRRWRTRIRSLPAWCSSSSPTKASACTRATQGRERRGRSRPCARQCQRRRREARRRGQPPAARRWAQAVDLRPRPRGGAASATTRAASRSTAASRPPTGACSPSARWPAERPMRRSPTTTPASSSAGRCSTRRRASMPRIIPRATFTDPELAYVGLSEAEAVKRAGKINVLRWPYRENDRAQAERTTDRPCQGHHGARRQDPRRRHRRCPAPASSSRCGRWPSRRASTSRP